MVGLRESIGHIGFFVISGLVAGLLWGSAVGWMKYDTLNHERLYRQKMERLDAENKRIGEQMCREFPDHIFCGDNEKRICTANPNDPRCRDYKQCTTDQVAWKTYAKCIKYHNW